MKKRHIVLAGGNGKGAFQAGVLQVLQNKGIEFDSAHGVSVGAINAAGVAIDAIPELVSLWRMVREDQIIKRGTIIGLASRLIRGYLPFFKHATGLHDTRPLLETLSAFLGNRELVMPLYAGRVGLRSSVYVDEVDPLKVALHVWRSTLIPAVMRAHVTPSDVWVDGGVHNVTPLGKVSEIASEGDEVFVVINEKRGTPPKPLKVDPRKANIVHILKTSIEYLVDMQFERDLDKFCMRNNVTGYKSFLTYVIEPSEGLGAGDDYSTKTLNRRIEQGIRDAVNFMQDYSPSFRHS